MVTAIVDDKSPLCVPFILDRLKEHRARSDEPFFIGLNGVQGAGKTTLVTALLNTLSSPPHSLPTLALSIDDLYLPHAALTALAAANPTNPLLQHRGEPSTHDIPLAASLFAALRARAPAIKVPSYDKSLHAGRGDRAPEDAWQVVNRPGEPPVEVVLFEGWCVGFRALSQAALVAAHRAAVDAAAVPDGAGGAPEGGAQDAVRARGRLARQQLQHVETVNAALAAYDVLTDALQAFVHIDAAETEFVYDWRLEQEAGLRASRGSGMTDAQVVEFVNGYYPAYELYADGVRKGALGEGEEGRQLCLVVGRDRRVQRHWVV